MLTAHAPTDFSMEPEYKLSESYVGMARMIGKRKLMGRRSKDTGKWRGSEISNTGD